MPLRCFKCFNKSALLNNMLVPHPSTSCMYVYVVRKCSEDMSGSGDVHFSPWRSVDPAMLIQDIQGSHVGNCPLQPFSQLAATHWSTSLLEVVVCTADLQGAMPFCSHSCTAPVILVISNLVIISAVNWPLAELRELPWHIRIAQSHSFCSWPQFADPCRLLPAPFSAELES